MSVAVAMQDGYYSAEEADFDEYGWKEFITIFVMDGKISSIVYDARNSSGFVKSWDLDYMRDMNRTHGTYPNQYARLYANALLETQTLDGVDAVSGATYSYYSFRRLVDAAMGQAAAGDTSVIYVDFVEVAQ